MTRDEYLQKRNALHPQFDCDLISKLDREYIEALEAENKQLKLDNLELMKQVEGDR
jgi:hypothetical protein